MSFLYVKALHIIFVVTWFAGLFYIVRLFIYQIEAFGREEPERSILVKEYKKNIRLLWLVITWPSAVLTLIFGTIVLLHVPDYLKQSFMQFKLVFVGLLYIYHFLCHRIYKQLQNDRYQYTSQQLRMWNEVATVLLVAIVFLIVLKNTMSMVWGLAGLFIFAVVLMLAIRVFKNLRKE